jgi:HK97 family phage prohead protease
MIKMSKKQQRSPSETFLLEAFEATSDPMTFRGVAFVWGYPVDTYPHPTVLARGAFAKTLAEQRDRVVVLWQHDQMDPIGKPLEMTETDRGLEVLFRLDEVSNGLRASKQLRSGTLSGLSIGFDALKFETVLPEDVANMISLTPDGRQKLEKEYPGSPVRLIKEVRLWEFSVVTTAAQDVARVTMSANAQRDLPIADTEVEWNADEAAERVRVWAEDDAERLSRAYLLTDEDGPKVLLADVIDGRLTAIPAAVRSAAWVVADLDGRAGAYGREHVGSYYERMNQSPPWEPPSDVRVALEAVAAGSTSPADLHKAIEAIKGLISTPDPSGSEGTPSPNGAQGAQEGAGDAPPAGSTDQTQADADAAAAATAAQEAAAAAAADEAKVAEVHRDLALAEMEAYVEGLDE